MTDTQTIEERLAEISVGITRLQRSNAQLLAALMQLVSDTDEGFIDGKTLDEARAAIANAKGTRI